MVDGLQGIPAGIRKGRVGVQGSKGTQSGVGRIHKLRAGAAAFTAAFRLRLDAADPFAPPSLLAAFSRSPDVYLRRLVAMNPACPPEVLGVLVADDDLQVVRWVMSHPLLPSGLLAAFAEDERWQVRALLASHVRCSHVLFEKLCQDPAWQVREVTASHPLALREQLEVLRQDSQPEVRCRVAVRPHIPLVWLERFTLDEDIRVRQAAGTNPTLPIPLLSRVLDDLGPQEVRTVLQRADLTPGVLDDLCHLPDPQVQLQVARHPLTPARALKVLLLSKNPQVCLEVARHAQCDLTVLQLLMRQVMQVPETKRLVEHLLQNPHLDGVILTQFAAFPQVEFQALAAVHPLTPPWVLDLLSRQQHPLVQQALLRNPATPLEVLERFMESPSPEVLARISVHPQSTRALLDQAVRELTVQQLKDLLQQEVWPEVPVVEAS